MSGLFEAPEEVIAIAPVYVPLARPMVATLTDRGAVVVPLPGVTASQLPPEFVDAVSVNTNAEALLLDTFSDCAAIVSPAFAASNLNSVGTLLRFGLGGGVVVDAVQLKVTPTF
jgi:hypothetical protein